MDGMLTVINLDVPTEGSEDMRTLADVFERTIRGILGEEYRVNVYQRVTVLVSFRMGSYICLSK